MDPAPLRNDEIADLLEDLALLVGRRDPTPWRSRAWREAARTVRLLPRPLQEVAAEGGRAALEGLPGVGRSIASALEEILRTGRLDFQSRLMEEAAPEDLFTLVPGVGDLLARRIRESLGIATLEELEMAAHDGRLSAVPGFGPRRVRAIEEVLSAMLSRSARGRARARASAPRPGRATPAAGGPSRPSVAVLLRIDARYREAAAAGGLRRIAPRRFNPAGEAWLPVMEGEEEGWRFTALFSNTARAHDLDKTRDWVVISVSQDGVEDRATVVTETRGPLTGRRVVRGRERETPAEATTSAP